LRKEIILEKIVPVRRKLERGSLEGGIIFA